MNLNNQFGPFSAKELTRRDFANNNVTPDLGLGSYFLNVLKSLMLPGAKSASFFALGEALNEARGKLH